MRTGEFGIRPCFTVFTAGWKPVLLIGVCHLDRSVSCLVANLIWHFVTYVRVGRYNWCLGSTRLLPIGSDVTVSP